ncbi:hypothetical protein MCOR32_009792 [Pyricularia oryzae]|nr:hypothetical protein MCOR32_009792 [Pyricularia oryzae]
MAPSPPPDTSAQSADTDQDGLPLAQVAQTQIKSYVVHKQHELSGMIKGEESKTETELHMHIKACLDAINYLGPSVEVGKNFKASILQHFPDDEDLGHLVYRKVMQGVKGRSPHWDIIGSKLREIVDILNDGYGDSGGESQQVGQLGASSESPGELPTPVSPIFSAQCKPPSSGRKRPPPVSTYRRYKSSRKNGGSWCTSALELASIGKPERSSHATPNIDFECQKEDRLPGSETFKHRREGTFDVTSWCSLIYTGLSNKAR